MPDQEKPERVNHFASANRPLRLSLSLIAALALMASACAATSETPPLTILSASSPVANPSSPERATPTAMIVPTIDRTLIAIYPNTPPTLSRAEVTSTVRANIAATSQARVRAIITATAASNNK